MTRPAPRAVFPTAVHSRAADEVVGFFAGRPGAESIVLVNSCARGMAVPESDVDVAVLVDRPVSDPAVGRLDREWREHYAAGAVFRELEAVSPFARVHVDLFDGRFVPEPWDDGGGPDAFELEIGNRVANAAALWDRSGRLDELRAAWLPFYAESLRDARLAMVAAACRLDVARVRFYSGRALYFQAFDRLYRAFQEFLQALFIARRVYPIAYDKWLREQIAGWLALPELYAELPPILQVPRLESSDVLRNADRLLALVERWIPATSAPK